MSTPVDCANDANIPDDLKTNLVLLFLRNLLVLLIALRLLVLVILLILLNANASNSAKSAKLMQAAHSLLIYYFKIYAGIS